jgi:hypothetical protein
MAIRDGPETRGSLGEWEAFEDLVPTSAEKPLRATGIPQLFSAVQQRLTLYRMFVRLHVPLEL